LPVDAAVFNFAASFKSTDVMKKAFFIFLTAMGTLASHADDYPYLTFETASGAKVSVPTASLQITISGTTLTAGTRTFTIADLSKMYFSASSETTTAIESIDNGELPCGSCYDLQGRKIDDVSSYRGVIVVKTKNGTIKKLNK
jgi:hypothetical protein